MVGSKATTSFAEHPKVKPWMMSLQSERTKEWYPYMLMRFLDGIKRTPDMFLVELDKNPKPTSIEVKSYLGSIESKGTARAMLSAVKSFTDFHEAGLKLNGLHIRVVRTRRKPYLSWTDAEKIIGEAKEPYRSAFRFLLWSGLGEDEFVEIQQGTEIQTMIEERRNDETKSYIRIDLKPRKANTDVFFTLVPKEYVPRFPVKTLDYGTRGGQLVEQIDLQMNWQRASKRVGLRQIGMGPHTLRSAFSSQCAKVGVVDAVAEFQMGHGAGDKYGYRRETEDESYVANELTKLWKTVTPITATALDEQNERISKLEADNENLRGQLRMTTKVLLRQINRKPSPDKKDEHLEELLAEIDAR